jgi:hypothetical protein
MAKGYVTEFKDVNAGSPVAAGGYLEQTPVTFTTTTQSAAFAANTVLIRVHVDAICSIAIGKDPTATTSTMRLVAGQTEYFAVSAGDKIAFVTNT